LKQKHAKGKTTKPPKKAHFTEGSGIERKLHDPVADKLRPVYPLDPEASA